MGMFGFGLPSRLGEEPGETLFLGKGEGLLLRLLWVPGTLRVLWGTAGSLSVDEDEAGGFGGSSVLFSAAPGLVSASS